jgi:hypothetical protein
MLLVAELPGTWPVAARARLRDHVMVRVRGFTLDAELAGGTSPEASTRLALRAQLLVRMRSRRDLARGIRRILARAQPPGPSRWPSAPVRADRVRAAAAELQALADRLLSPAPLPARGIAQARMLLCDAGSPLYRRGSADDLGARVAAAVRSLDPLGSW